jgi:excisionase family DNA binding protein
MKYKNKRDIINSREAAALLKVSRATISDLMKKGVLEGFKIDREFRIYVDSMPNYKNLVRKEK